MRPLRLLAGRMSGLARGRSGRATSWAMLGQITAIVASTANFLLLARLVGPAEYGLVAGTWALVLALSPIATLGSDRLLIRDVGASRTTPGQALGAALLTAAVGWLVVVGGLAALHSLLLPQTPLLLLLALALADVVALGVSVLVTALCFASGNARAAGISSIVVNATKLLAVVTFALTGSGDPVTWAMIYAGYALVSAAGQLTFALWRFGRPTVRGYRFTQRVREGLPYSGNVVAMVVQNDADKTLLVRNGLTVEAGHYSVAYRLASMAYLPVLAVLQVMLPRFFAAGEDGGIRATAAFARRLVKPLLAYAVFATLALLVCAPLVPLVVGEQYRGSVPLLMLLAPLVIVKVVQSVTGDVLTGAGKQHVRTMCVGATAATNVAANLVLIPVMGVSGALVATFLAEVLQAVLLLLAVRRNLRAAPPAKDAGAAPEGSPVGAPTGTGQAGPVPQPHPAGGAQGPGQ
ncbi:O-antigen/teichoic acid export membrane protein [Kineococcus xinjiangensis]|uniref:O-antigen/teichoic acid export membrane protein n=1 Tax=Kineococcus xinjiangensis TaxID=512762 RepID=A0A2S6ISL5_9ACTN|nr:lipopolysaccharide biosynthesis protein [Kineococcus xinjiangensis]PPK97242.1 O-antigen/teichoic acid export membrane protein [Kineococcus xinjiangensis]